MKSLKGCLPSVLNRMSAYRFFTAEDVYAFHLNEDERSWLFSFKPDSIVCEETSLAFFKGEHR